MTKKEKDLMIRLLSTNWALSGLCAYYQDNDKEGLKDVYDVTFKELEQARDNLIKLLKK